MQEVLIGLLYLAVIIIGYMMLAFLFRLFSAFAGKPKAGKFSIEEAQPLVQLFGGQLPQASLNDYLKDVEVELPVFRSAPILGQSCYFVLADRTSPVNRVLIDKDAWKEAKAVSSVWNRLNYYNEFWVRYQDHEKAAVWTFLIGGVYTIGLRILPPSPVVDFARANGFLGNWEDKQSEQLVQFPSGELIVSPPEELGKPDLPVFARVAPGRYRVGLFSNYKIESKHQSLNDVKEYKDLGRSDWELLLQKFD